MGRITATFTISLPPGMAAELELVRKQEHRTRSELIREALRRYFAFRNVEVIASIQKNTDKRSTTEDRPPH